MSAPAQSMTTSTPIEIGAVIFPVKPVMIAVTEIKPELMWRKGISRELSAADEFVSSQIALSRLWF